MTQKKKPVLRFKGFTDDWEQRKLGEMLEFRNGFNGSSEIYGGDTPLISVMDILNNNFITHDKILAHVCVDNNIKERFKISYGDVLFQRSSENYEDAGTSNVYIDRQNNAIFGGFVIAGKKLKEYDPICFKYLLDSKYVRNQIIRKAQGAQHINVSQDTLQNVAIYIPNMEEQNKIGAYLHNIDHLITLHQRKYEKLRNLKKFFLEKIFPQNGKRVPEVRFAGFTGDWEQRKLGELGTTYTGISGKTSSDFGHGDARFITYMNVYSNAIANPLMVEPIEIDQKQNEVKVGDVFFTTSSETPDEVGMSSVLLEKQGTVYLNSFCFGYRPKEKIDLHYLAFMLRSEVVRKKIIFLAQGISRYNISKNKMMEISVPLPTIEEQSKIGGFLNNLDNLITLHQRKVEALQKLKKSLLQQMFV